MVAIEANVLLHDDSFPLTDKDQSGKLLKSEVVSKVKPNHVKGGIK